MLLLSKCRNEDRFSSRCFLLCVLDASPYRYNNGQQLQQQQPNRGPPPQQYSQYPYQQQPPQQQFNFTTGTMYGQQQQQQQQQQRGYPQQHMPSGYAPVTYGQPAYPGAASSIPTHLSHPALQATKQNEIQQLMAAPGMTKNLNPYELVVQQLARNMLNATSHTANQITGAAGGAYHTTLNFTISQAYLLRMKRANRPPAAGQESQQLEAHLRLFSGITLEHFHWDRKFTVRVNGHEVTIPEPKKLSKSKKKGLELVRGLDISEYVQASNTVEVTAHRASFTVELFRGLVMADLIRIRDTSELLEEFKRKIKDEESKLQATALERCCIICQSKKDPLRCSRCKNEWYCGIVHQKEHWPAHRTSCTQPTPEQDAIREAHEKKAAQEAMLGKNGRTKLIMPVKVKHEGADGLGENELEDGVEEVDTLVSLKCPLSLERYELPARGRNCAHLTCFNLETYLMFSQQSGIWQCPWCYKGLPCEEIEINLQMAAILRETDGEIAQIRVHPNGEYDPIKDRPDGESGDGREPGRKRKQPSGSPTNVPAAAGGPQKIQALGSAAGAAPDMAGSIAAAASANEANGWIPAEGGISFSAAGTVPAGASSGLDGQHAPNGNGLTTSAPEAGGPAGTADEPIELD
jgi:hypothetical protein